MSRRDDDAAHDAWRAKLGDVIADEPTGLPEPARERVLRAVLSASAAPRASGTAAVVIAAALAAAAGLVIAWSLRDVPASPSRAGQPRAAGAARAPRACSTWTTPEVAPQADGALGRLDLGRRGVAVATGADVTLGFPDACSTLLDLRRGRVTVRAADLGGGELRVRAGDVEAWVRGTIFAVSRDPGGVDVLVEEGAVLTRRGRDEREVHAGRAARWSERGVVLRDLSAAERQALRGIAAGEGALPSDPAVIADPPPGRPDRSPAAAQPAPAPEPAPPTLGPADTSLALDPALAEAERRWLAGDEVAARAELARAGARPGRLGEAAWVLLGRLELRAGRPDAARRLLHAREGQFTDPGVEAEALWVLAVACYRVRASSEIRRVAQELLRKYPTSSQAITARRLLGPDG